MKGKPMDILRLVDYIKANGPVSANEAMIECGYTSGKDVNSHLSAYAAQHGKIRKVNGKWERLTVRESGQYIPTFKPMRGYNLWAGAMRPGSQDYRAIRSRVV